MHPKYKHMVDKMLSDEQAGVRQSDKSWFLYILKCQNDTFYTGVTKDLKRRLDMHNKGTASRYTRSRRPVKMIYSESCETRAQALTREYQVKALSRKQKEVLVKKAKAQKKKGKTHG